MIESPPSFDLLDHLSPHMYLSSMSYYTMCLALNWMQRIKNVKATVPSFETLAPQWERDTHSLWCGTYEEGNVCGMLRDLTQEGHPS